MPIYFYKAFIRPLISSVTRNTAAIFYCTVLLSDVVQILTTFHTEPAKEKAINVSFHPPLCMTILQIKCSDKHLVVLTFHPVYIWRYVAEKNVTLINFVSEAKRIGRHIRIYELQQGKKNKTFRQLSWCGGKAWTCMLIIISFLAGQLWAELWMNLCNRSKKLGSLKSNKEIGVCKLEI